MLIAHWPKESAPMQGALILFVTVAQFTAEVSGQEKPIQTETINSKKDEDTLRQLLLKRRIALKQHVAAVQAAFEDDAIQFSAVMTAQRLLLDAELELCNSPAERIAVHEKTVEIHKDIEKRIAELGRQISADYAGQSHLRVIGALRGCFVFMADLIRAIEMPVKVDFMEISSYGSSTTSSGNIKILKDLSDDVHGEHVVIAEDIIDTGLTRPTMIDLLNARGIASAMTRISTSSAPTITVSMSPVVFKRQSPKIDSSGRRQCGERLSLSLRRFVWFLPAAPAVWNAAPAFHATLRHVCGMCGACSSSYPARTMRSLGLSPLAMAHARTSCATVPDSVVYSVISRPPSAL